MGYTGEMLLWQWGHVAWAQVPGGGDAAGPHCHQGWEDDGAGSSPGVGLVHTAPSSAAYRQHRWDLCFPAAK